MRINSINSIRYNSNAVNIQNKNRPKINSVQCNTSGSVSFKGWGKVLGGAVGLAGAAVALAVAGPLIPIAAPIFAGICTTAGAKAGDDLEKENANKNN